MMVRILVGALVTLVLVASCAAEPEHGTPTTVAGDAANDFGEPSAPANSEGEPAGSDDGDQEGPEAVTTATRPSTPPRDPGDVAVGKASEPPAADTTVPQDAPPALPEPGGPWIDPRKPDTTKIIPPPRR